MTTTIAAIQTVLIDQRQPPILDHLGYDSAPVVRAPLAAGSINLIAHDGTLIAIERIPAESLPMAIRRGALSDRAAALRALTAWAYLVIVGECVSDRKGKAVIAGQATGWDWRSIQGALLSVQELGVSVLNCSSDNQLGDLLLMLARRNRGPVKVKPLRNALFTTPQEAILMSIPGIGEETADHLLAICPNVAWALVALTNPVYAPGGIGPKTIATARRILGLPDGMQLSIDQPMSE